MSKFLLIITTLTLSACSTQEYRHYYTQAQTTQEPNSSIKLEQLREQNFSVLRTQMVMKGLSMDNPMLIRAFKSEMKLELWVKSSYSKQYKLFKSYDICSKSGTLGPKLKEGDRQTPEGFYDVKQHRLNPNSKYFLSFNIGFPNKYDRSLGRTGSHLMIHGSCVSEGCFAMTDRSIAEIYLIIEHNFKYGHEAIPIHIYPFRMTQENMMARNSSRWYPFWKNLKQGYDYFETHRIPAKPYAHNGRYAFNYGEYY